ncbi:MAG: EamA family transporter [Clostridia bacterium]|nr:EamA family transporter [Clostridia bacterium]
MKNGVLYALLTAILFVTLEPVSKLIANSVNPFAITFWRFLIGSLILLPFALIKIRKEKVSITALDIVKMALLGVLCICVSMLSLQIAVKQADTPSLIAIIFSANSVFTICLAVLINKEKITANKIIALVLGVTGVVLCADFSSGTNLTSVLLAVFSAVTFSLYTVISQKYTRKFGGLIQSSIVFSLGSIILLIGLLFMKVDISIPLDTSSLLIMLYLALFVTGLGYICYFKAIEKGGAIMASLAFFAKPILTPFATFFINGITPAPKVFLSVLCIAAASYFAVYFKKNKA